MPMQSDTKVEDELTSEEAQAEEFRKVHEAALLEFDKIQSATRDEREQSLRDRRFCFIAGAQWEGDLAAQFDNKPKFEFNKIALSNDRVESEYRNNRITVDFISKDGKDRADLADLCDGLYRADEQDSEADEAYDNAFTEAMAGGMGAWRLRAELEDDEDEEDERQRICIEPIFDADNTVYFDLNAKRQDKRDAKRCYVLTAMSPEAYEEEYGEDPSSWPNEVANTEFDWATPEVVFVAELYKIEEVEEIVQIWQDIDGTETRYRQSEFDENPEFEKELTAKGSKFIEAKSVEKKKCHKYVMSGSRVLEDCGFIAGSCIPIVPVYGKRVFVDNVERFQGRVRQPKDAQRLKNMQLSKLAEISALSSVSKPIVTPEQIAGHEETWANDNIENYAYLLLNPIKNEDGQEQAAGPVGYTNVPVIPPAMAALLQMTEMDMKEMLGNQEAGEQVVSNVSGKAVELIQGRIDMQAFIYMSNMAKAMKRSGEIWLSMARDIYVEDGRTMRTLKEDGTTSLVKLNEKTVDENQQIVSKNDLSNAKFQIYASVGPSSDSKRSALVRALTGMVSITEDPETKMVLTSMALMNMEGEGLSEVQAFFRNKLIRIGALKPTEEEAAAMVAEAQNAKPSPQDQYFTAAAAEAEAKGKQAESTVLRNIAAAEKDKADAMKILSDLTTQEQQHVMDILDKLGVLPSLMPQGAPMQPVTEATPPMTATTQPQ